MLSANVFCLSLLPLNPQ
uniref:Uncharacterized protein n=1 Tax=Arundo donax TaxID=35708 RepID=A0A0A9EK45_ARUDO